MGDWDWACFPLSYMYVPRSLHDHCSRSKSQSRIVSKTFCFRNYSKAKLLLRKKKFQENLLVKTDGQLENIERMVSNTQFVKVSTQSALVICGHF